jgi:hypothetical protein
MSFREFLDPVRRAQPTAFTAASIAATAPIFVEVGAEVTEANITREGSKVPSLALDPSVVEALIEIAPRPRYKVLRQSVEAGRAVERGTVVNLVLAEPDDLPIGIVGGVLADLGDRKIGEVYGTLVGTQPEVKRILGRRAGPSELTASEKETLLAALGQGGFQVDPDDDEAVAGAFTGLQTLHLFGG